jgi:hypothetical protein
MAFDPHFVVTGLAGATGSAHVFDLFESRHERRSNQISHATVEATIRPLADMISTVVVSTTKPPGRSLAAWGRNGEAQLSYG